MELLIQIVAAPLIGSLPFLVSLLLCWMCSSWRRWLAIVLSFISGSIFVFEFYSALVGGNLTGLIWILSLPVLVIAFFALFIVEKASRHQNQSEANTSTDNGNEALPKHIKD